MTNTLVSVGENGRGTENTRFNALRHGVLSRFVVLPWEDPDEYGMLLGSLVAEHQPCGPTEEHLVEELAGIFWRKRRLRLAEAAAHRRGLEHTFSDFRGTANSALAHLGKSGRGEGVMEAVGTDPAQTGEELLDVDEDETMTRQALDLLSSHHTDAYERAIEILREDTRDWWQELLTCDPCDHEEDEEPVNPTAEGLRSFLESKVLPWYESRRSKLDARPLVREQAFGESLDPNKLERLARYEVHLDRKLERMLSMLLRLRDLRAGDPAA